MRPSPALMILTALVCIFHTSEANACELKRTSLRKAAPTASQGQTIRLTVPSALRAATFQLRQGQGHYLESRTGVEYSPTPTLTLSAETSWVSLTVGSSHYSSPANPKLSAEYTALPLPQFNATLGSRLEIPNTSANHRIAASHLELVPYTRLQWIPNAYHLTLQLGASVGLEPINNASGEGHHDHHAGHHHGASAHPTQFVNPHTDREFLFQLRGGRQWLANTLDSSVFLDGQTVLADSDPGTTFLSAGLSLSAQWGDHVQISLDAERSISIQQRFTWRSAIGVTLLL